MVIFIFADSDIFAFTESEESFLRMYNPDQQFVVTATRYLKPLSQTAENMTVITSEEIETMNAHTLADVLYYINGVQMTIEGSPGSVAYTHIQGSEYRHVRVMIDGVTINDLSDTFADVGSLPVQIIDSIEIIKGPASSTWGSSLGGVINIITKTRNFSTDDPEGSIRLSYGEGQTYDLGAELYGKSNRTRYYFYGSQLKTDGLRSHNKTDWENLYASVDWELSENVNVKSTLGYREGERDIIELSEYDTSTTGEYRYLFSTLALNVEPVTGMTLNISLRTTNSDYLYLTDTISTGMVLDEYTEEDRVYGASARFTWLTDKHNIIVGSDYDYNELESNNLTDRKQDFTRAGFYFNDTIVYKEFSITPGVRFDSFDIYDDFWSPSLGVTYKAGKHTLIRLSASRGFNVPSLFHKYGDSFFYAPNDKLEVERVNSYQLGFETALSKYIWLKTTLFRHDIRNAIESEFLDPSWTFVNINKQKREGIEAEIKSARFYDFFTILAGFTFINTKDSEQNGEIPESVSSTVDIELKYENNKHVNISLRGHYINRKGVRPLFGDRDSTFIWDIHLNKSVKNSKVKAEMFMSIRNLFSEPQYLDTYYKNPDRWIEAGVKITF